MVIVRMAPVRFDKCSASFTPPVFVHQYAAPFYARYLSFECLLPPLATTAIPLC
jgi:hypothetical protein